MTDEKRYEGYWWLPDEVDNKVGGVLTFSPTDGVELRLFSALDDDQEKTRSSEPVEFETVFGKTTENENITVKNTYRKNYKTFYAGGESMMQAEHRSSLMYQGMHIDSVPQFERVVIDYPQLFGWYGRSGIEIEFEESENESPVTTVQYQSPNSERAELNSIVLTLLPTESHSSSSGMEQISEDAQFIVEPDDGTLSLERIREIEARLQAFLTLSCGEEIHSTGLSGHLKSFNNPFKSIEIMYTRPNYKLSSTGFDINKYTFEFSDIEDRFESVMRTWFDSYERLKPVFDLFFSVQYNSSQYVQTEFLTLTRAIESYHRIDHNGLYLDPDEFSEYYDELVDSIHDDHDQSFKAHLKNGTFKYANEYSFGKRLRLLNDLFEHLIDTLPVDFSEVIQPMVDARNDLTHQDMERGTPDPENLIHYTNVLRALIEMILLKEITIPDEQIIQRVAVRHHHRLKGYYFG